MKKIFITVSFLLLGITLSFSQHKVTGKVMDLYSNPISEVTISLQGSDIKTQSDKDGNYTINAPDKNGVLVFAKEKLMTDRMKIQGRKKVDIVMIRQPKKIEE